MSDGDNNAFELVERASGQPTLLVRLARVEDRDAVLAFCAQTWTGGDYIQHVWDEWLGAADGALLVAVLGDRPVGLLHLRMLAEHEGWIEGVRVDPTVRRQGIARALLMRALADARQRSAQVVRMITDADNLPSQRLFGGFGFTRVAEVVRYEAPALAETPETPETSESPGAMSAADGNESDTAAGEALEQHLVDEASLESDDLLGPRLTIAGAEDLDRIWQWLEQSNLAPFTAGLEFDGWAALALSETSLRQHLAAGGVWLLEEWQTIQALAITEPIAASADEHRPQTLQVRYLDGTSDGIGRLALVLREVAGEQSATAVTLWLPDILILRDAMDGAGFAREDAMRIYARSL